MTLLKSRAKFHISLKSVGNWNQKLRIFTNKLTKLEGKCDVEGN